MSEYGYQYKVIPIWTVSTQQQEALLNAEARNGWRLVTVTEGRMYLEAPHNELSFRRMINEEIKEQARVFQAGFETQSGLVRVLPPVS